MPNLERRVLRGLLYAVLGMSGLAGLVPGSNPSDLDFFRRTLAWAIATVALAGLAASARRD